VLEAGSALGFLVYPALEPHESFHLEFQGDGRYLFSYFLHGPTGKWEPLFSLTVMLPIGSMGMIKQDVAFMTPNPPISRDEAMRVAGIVTLCGIGDIYFAGGLPHNLRLYTPSDGGLAHFLPWDMDFVFTAGTTSTIYPSGNNFAKLMNNATTQRRYLSHINDLCQPVFNTDYMNPWLAHYGAVVGQNYSSASSYISSRRTYALSQLPAVAPHTSAVVSRTSAILPPEAARFDVPVASGAGSVAPTVAVDASWTR
jgi:hypothetical protein